MSAPRHSESSASGSGHPKPSGRNPTGPRPPPLHHVAFFRSSVLAATILPLAYNAYPVMEDTIPVPPPWDPAEDWFYRTMLMLTYAWTGNEIAVTVQSLIRVLQHTRFCPDGTVLSISPHLVRFILSTYTVVEEKLWNHRPVVKPRLHNFPATRFKTNRAPLTYDDRFKNVMSVTVPQKPPTECSCRLHPRDRSKEPHPDSLILFPDRPLCTGCLANQMSGEVLPWFRAETFQADFHPSVFNSCFRHWRGRPLRFILTGMLFVTSEQNKNKRRLSLAEYEKIGRAIVADPLTVLTRWNFLHRTAIGSIFSLFGPICHTLPDAHGFISAMDAKTPLDNVYFFGRDQILGALRQNKAAHWLKVYPYSTPQVPSNAALLLVDGFRSAVQARKRKETAEASRTRVIFTDRPNRYVMLPAFSTAIALLCLRDDVTVSIVFAAPDYAARQLGRPGVVDVLDIDKFGTAAGPDLEVVNADVIGWSSLVMLLQNKRLRNIRLCGNLTAGLAEPTRSVLVQPRCWGELLHIVENDLEPFDTEDFVFRGVHGADNRWARRRLTISLRVEPVGPEHAVQTRDESARGAAAAERRYIRKEEGWQTFPRSPRWDRRPFLFPGELLCQAFSLAWPAWRRAREGEEGGEGGGGRGRAGTRPERCVPLVQRNVLRDVGVGSRPRAHPPPTPCPPPAHPLRAIPGYGNIVRY